MEDVIFVKIEQSRYEEFISYEARLAILQDYVSIKDGMYLDDDFIRLLLGMEVKKAVTAVENKDD